MAGNVLSKVEILQYGLGGVGRHLLGLVAQNAAFFEREYGIELRYRALANSRSFLQLEETASLAELAGTLAPGAAARLDSLPGARPLTSEMALLQAGLAAKGAGARLVVVDVSGASDTGMAPVILEALRQGQGAALANKRPLCGPVAQFKAIMAAAGPGSLRLRHETTVGAALPVISTIRALLDARDTIYRVSGTFSGTLGYLTTRLEEGAAYSQAVAQAKALGYTEPDPRDDLGGLDVARKALILSRLLGGEEELNELAIEALYPPEMAGLTIPEFMERLPELDETYKARFGQAAAQGQALRYVATVSEGRCRVGLESVSQDSPLGRLRGTNNMIVFQTARYNDAPLVVQGPGAGGEITASGVLSDIISLARAAW